MSTQDLSRAPRARTQVAARAVLTRGSTTSVACVVQNLSPEGACVVLPEGLTVPRYFNLHIGRSTRARRVRVVWERAATVGVAFLEPQPDAPEVLAD